MKNMSVKVELNQQVMRKLRCAWGVEYNTYINGLQRGVAVAFQNLPNQIQTVFESEGYCNSHQILFSFELRATGCNENELEIAVDVAPNSCCTYFFFDVLEVPKGNEFDYSGKGTGATVSELGFKIFQFIQQLAAKMARDGLTTDMKRNIHHLAKVFKHCPPHRIKNDSAAEV